ncbi:hypothetical protein BKA70DRAFT_1418126 [Coprinopsis sp. MPI-PUGE-AT-0042]|nr:hypothetical protein BKA70DRAFT_1418126 [Coprinopsis sp. MPI-PUGE-AT-0042]
MDFVRSLDTSKLLLLGTGLSFCISVIPSLAYNLPIFLFGTFLQDQQEASQSLQTFSGLLAVSAFFDLYSFFRSAPTHNFLTTVITLLLLFVKVPTLLAFSAALRQRGGDMGLGIGGQNLQGATLWSMPGGFTSGNRDGYEQVDDNSTFVRPPHTSIPANPSMPAPQVPASQAPPGAYQNV